MSPIKNELSIKLALGQKVFNIGDLLIDLNYGTTSGKIPEEIRVDVYNIMKRARKESGIKFESRRQTRKRNSKKKKLQNEFKRRSTSPRS